MAERMTPSRQGAGPEPAARVGGVLVPILLVGVAFAVVRSIGSDEGVHPSQVFAALFFGFLIYDIAVALGMATSRMRGHRSGRYSSIVAFNVIFSVMWLLATWGSGAGPTGWMDNTWTTTLVGLAAIAVQIGSVRSLDQLGRTHRAEP